MEEIIKSLEDNGSDWAKQQLKVGKQFYCLLHEKTVLYFPYQQVCCMEKYTPVVGKYNMAGSPKGVKNNTTGQHISKQHNVVLGISRYFSILLVALFYSMSPQRSQ